MPTAHKARVGLGIAIVVMALIVVGIFFLRRSDETPSTAVQTTPPSQAAPATAAPAAAAAPTAQVEYVNDRLRREIATQGLTVDRARQLFAIEVMALPGVTVPAGPTSPTISGTYAFTQLMAMKSQLTPEQQAVLRELLDATRSTLPPNAPALPQFQPPQPTIRPAAYYVADDEDQQKAAKLAFLQQIYDWANTQVGALTGQAKIPKFKLAIKELNEPDTMRAWALSTYWADGVKLDACQSDVDLRKFNQQPIDVYISVITHEVVHCYQQMASPSAHAVATTWPWLFDGEATWVQMAIVPNAAFQALQTHWFEYLAQPTAHLFARKYDAAGFYGHVADILGDDAVGKRLIPTYLAGAGGTNEPAFAILTAGVQETVFETWASSYFRTHENQFLWTAKGPGTVNFPSQKAKPTTLTVAAGDAVEIPAVAPWELGLYRVESSADIVQIVSAQGYLAVIDESEQVNKRPQPFQPVFVCLREECKCPPDTEGQVPETIKGKAAIDIGLTGGKSGASGWVAAQSLQDHCRPKPDSPMTRKLPKDPGGGGGLGDNGEPANGKVTSDPHLVTLDGRYYDLQTIGEFVLTRAANDFTPDAFAVHVRFGQIGALTTVSVASAMGVRVGKDRISVTLDTSSGAGVPVLRINGTITRDDFVSLNAGSVRSVFSQDGTGYVVELLDRTRVGVSPFARQGLNVWINPSPALKGKLTGLLGNNDGDQANDPIVRGTSKVLSATPDYDELYTSFADSWRISQQESLLDYIEDQTTASMSNRAFPDRSAPPIEPTALATAEATCRAGGIVNLALLKNCAFDLAATGNQRYVRAYQPQQARENLATELAGLRGNGVVTASTASGRTKSVVLEGRVTDAAADAFASFQGFKGDVIYLDPDNCQKPRAMRILAFDGRQVGGIAPACGERLTLPADGTYKLSLNPFHDFTGPYRVSIAAVRPDRVTTIAIGDTLTGTLAARAEQDVFLLTMKTPGAITIGGAGCTANGEASVYYGDSELVGTGPACRLDKITLPKAGTYRIVINPFNNTTGAYSIPTK